MVVVVSWYECLRFVYKVLTSRIGNCLDTSSCHCSGVRAMTPCLIAFVFSMFNILYLPFVGMCLCKVFITMFFVRQFTVRVSGNEQLCVWCVFLHGPRVFDDETFDLHLLAKRRKTMVVEPVFYSCHVYHQPHLLGSST